MEDDETEENAVTIPEATVVTEPIYDPEIDTAIDSGQLSCESEYDQPVIIISASQLIWESI